jgi:hypothetical protein
VPTQLLIAKVTQIGDDHDWERLQKRIAIHTKAHKSKRGKFKSKQKTKEQKNEQKKKKKKKGGVVFIKNRHEGIAKKI